ncbi:hypothetical protein LHYA1_G005101 [Lachnellula hyalina]|uniref:Uncharacterized protein n=1 Tax=Lachnellula hyalina TaxID=1316788 RepID=A0A8H8R141_9HELO|nr:uncharacterized protein LHYA1_G005101 [Lachnellula hyalina]TVY25500.1 hypothetical protein LHYA1_G005101 [Lachnellula hyalina]
MGIRNILVFGMVVAESFFALIFSNGTSNSTWRGMPQVKTITEILMYYIRRPVGLHNCDYHRDNTTSAVES